jgi:intracellular multiplication protein IcmO
LNRTAEKRKIYGLESNQEIDNQRLYRDIRPLILKALDPFRSAQNQCIVIIATSTVGFLIPALMMPAFLFACLVTIIAALTCRNRRLPWKLPMASKIKRDPGSRKPNSRSHKAAEGVYFLGNEHDSHEELWLSIEDLLAHFMVLGTTGSGKTELFLALAFNGLATASGCLFIDAKAGPELAMKLYHICRMLGRDDDLLLQNFRTGGKNIDLTTRSLSNNTNPFAFGSSDALTQLLVSLMPKEKDRNSIFQANAQTLVTGMMRALVELRDAGKLDLSIETIRSYFNLVKIVELSDRPDLSLEAQEGVKQALSTVGWREDKLFEEQTQAFSEQFGYAAAYFGLTLSSMTSTYGHIFNSGSMGEVDMYDVIRNRRILVVTLPAVEKAPQELENLGRVVLSSIRNACAVGLGDRIEGTVEDVINSLPINSTVPMLAITDEYAAIATPGYEQVFTQGRGLGVAGVLGSQDYAGMKKADESGAQQIVDNTRTKIAMRLQGGEETWRLLSTITGRGKAMMSTGSEQLPQSPVPGYRDRLTTSPEKMDRIDLRDLQSQIEGEFHGVYNGSIVRAASFYTDIKLRPDNQLRINRQLEVAPTAELDCYDSIMNQLANDWFEPIDGYQDDDFFEFSLND